MKSIRGTRAGTTAAVAACLTLPLWLGSCGGIGSGDPSGNAAAARSGPAAAPSAGASLQAPVPAPAPQPAPAATTPFNGGAGSVPPSTAPPPASGAGGYGSAGTPPVIVPGTATSATATAKTPPQPVPAPGRMSTGTAAGVTVYYVLLDDGGSSGIRFGCNDSLVAFTGASPGPGDPLMASLGSLLDGSSDAEAAGLYNALAASSLEYVSGYFDGTTVVVNLTGSVQPGGACDIPRVEAQLTHTAVKATGASRAEIYIDGVRLAEVLSLK